VVEVDARRERSHRREGLDTAPEHRKLPTVEIFHLGGEDPGAASGSAGLLLQTPRRPQVGVEEVEVGGATAPEAALQPGTGKPCSLSVAA
jgi:hypothetical protein